MTKLSNFAENQLCDFMRGQTLTLPTDWFFALCSAADDTGATEVTGTSYGRTSYARSLANFSGTQGAGTTVASTGTSHETRNNNAITTPTAGAGGWTAATFFAVFDATSAGNMWFWGPLGSTVTVASGNAFTFAANSVVFQLGLTGGMTDYLANKLIDLIWRAQAFTWPATTYLRLCTTTPTNAAGGVEVTGTGYARLSIASSLSAWSGTQGAGTTVASSGTSGRISNNGTLTHGAVGSNWGTATHSELMDASSGGNRLFWGPLGTPRTINNGAVSPRYDPNTVGVTLA